MTITTKIHYTIDQFAQLFSKQSTYVFPANQKVKISQVDSRLCWLYLRSLDKGAVNSTDLQKFSDILNDAILPLGIKIDSLTANGKLNINCKYKDESRSVSFISDNQV